MQNRKLGLILKSKIGTNLHEHHYYLNLHGGR